MKLSLCIAVFNEAKNLHYPLDSALDIVDEVIIVDGGSTDRTVGIAKSYGKKVKVIDSDNPIMFHKNKQKAIEAARGEWILQLDADEELSEDLKQEIKTVTGPVSPSFPSGFGSQKVASTPPGSLKSQHPSPVAFWLPRKNWFLTRFLEKGGVYPDYTIRLYRNGYAKFPCKDVHENVEIITPVIPAKVIDSEVIIAQTRRAGIQVSGNKSIGYLRNPILHYADPDFSRYLKRWDRYTTAEVRVLRAKPVHFFDYFFWKPFSTFFMMYFRHKGFMDGFPGFVFALFSSIRFWVIYTKWRTKRLS